MLLDETQRTRVKQHLNKTDSVTALAARQDGQVYFIALTQVWFPHPELLPEHFWTALTEAKIKDFPSLSTYCQHQQHCLNYLKASDGNTYTNDLLRQLSEYPEKE
jgi:hypothetical protein